MGIVTDVFPVDDGFCDAIVADAADDGVVAVVIVIADIEDDVDDSLLVVELVILPLLL